MFLRSLALSALLVLAACSSSPVSVDPTPGVAAAGTAGASSAPPATSTAGAATPTAPIDLSGLDVCALLDEQTLVGLAGASFDFRPAASPIFASGGSCFWGVLYEPTYVEISVFKRPGLAGYNFAPGTDCQSAPVTAEIEAVGGTCSSPQHKVYLSVADGGLAMTLLVNEPRRPLEPSDLTTTLRSALESVAGQ
jgi:hypothetical protein